MDTPKKHEIRLFSNKQLDINEVKKFRKKIIEMSLGVYICTRQGDTPIPPHRNYTDITKQLKLKTNGQNTTNKRGSPLAFL